MISHPLEILKTRKMQTLNVLQILEYFHNIKIPTLYNVAILASFDILQFKNLTLKIMNQTRYSKICCVLNFKPNGFEVNVQRYKEQKQLMSTNLKFLTTF